MNADNDGAALYLDTVPEAADYSERGAVQETRVVILVVSGSDLDTNTLAKHLAQAGPMVPSVTLVSVGEDSANGTLDGTPVDYASICALIRQHLAHRRREHDASDVDIAADASTGGPGKCAPVASGAFAEGISRSDEPARPPRLQRDERKVALSAPRGSILHRHHESGRRNGARSAAAQAQSLSPGTSRANGAAHVDGNDARLSARGVSDAITVMIASNREGLVKSLLPRLASEHDIELLGEPAANAAHLLMRLNQWRPNLLLLDKGLLERFGPRSIRAIQARVPGVRVLLLCDAVCSGLAEEIVGNQFHGILLTGCPPDVCLKAIRAVSRGELWLPRALLVDAISESLQALAPRDAAAEIDRSLADAKNALTRREAQIVEHLRQGLSNKEIARKLGIMEGTVKKHLQSVFPKFGVHRRAMVVLLQAARQSTGA